MRSFQNFFREDTIQFKALDYIKSHEAIQETIKKLKLLKENKNLPESEIAKFLLENHSTALDLKDSKYRFYWYDDRIMIEKV